MTIEELKNFGYEDSIYFSLSDGTPEYEEAIIGVSTDGNIIYSQNKMISYLVKHDKLTPEEALEHIEYNVIRSIPYAQSLAGEGIPPIIMNFEAEDYDILNDEAENGNVQSDN